MNPISPESSRPYPDQFFLNVADRDLEIVQVLLQLGVLLCHLLVLALPLVPGGFERLHLAFVVTSLDIGLAEPATRKRETELAHASWNQSPRASQPITQGNVGTRDSHR